MHCVRSCDKGNVTIDIIPDDVLLLIFRLDGLKDLRSAYILSWHRLIHVCKRWRTIVFGSPNFLRLRLVCGRTTTRMVNIGIWPPFPIIINNIRYSSQPDKYDFNALVRTAIVHRNRVCEINLFNLTSSMLLRLVSAMQEKFPALTNLRLDYNNDLPSPALPDGILGEYAHHLQSLVLHRIPIPTIPQLLLSTTDLVQLELELSHFVFISPREIVPSLAMLAKLQSLVIEFESYPSHLDLESRHLPLLPRSILPTLGYLGFGGACEYLEDLLARIDAPLLYAMYIQSLDQLINTQPIKTQQLSQFIGRTPKLKTFEEAHITCCNMIVTVELDPSFSKFIELQIQCRESDLEPSFLMSSLPPLPTVQRLYFDVAGTTPSTFAEIWCIRNTQWLELSHSFTALKELHFVSKKFASTIMPMLQALVGEGVTEVLPALRHIYLPEFELSEPIQEAIQQFVAARQLSGHPLTVHIGDGSQRAEAL